MRKIFEYLCRRAGERSTLGDIAAGVTAAALVPYPWSLVAFLVLTAKALVPDGPALGTGK